MKTIQQQIIEFLSFLPFDLSKKTEEKINELTPNYEIIALDYGVGLIEGKPYLEITYIPIFEKLPGLLKQLYSRSDLIAYKSKIIKIT